MEKKCIQLEMNFNGSAENRFRDALNSGTFQILTELVPPSADTRPADAVAKYSEMENLVQTQTALPAALAFTDSAPSGETLDPVTFAASICPTTRDRHVLYLRGRDRTLTEVFELARHAESEGFRNFCAVTGSTVRGDGVRETARRHFTESVNTLKRLRMDFGDRAECGCVVNPFKYTQTDNYAQYYKLVKKINFGASFVTAQYGWDMLKLQELSWFLFRRDLHIPLIARMLYLTPERAERICSGEEPGVRVSPDFEKLLDDEMRYSRVQFQAAQLRRIQLHAAGIRYLGFSGIQLSGIDTPELLDTVLKQISGSFTEFHSFEEWKEAFQDYYARLDMAPYPYRFYMFDKLLSSARPPAELHLKDAPAVECSPREKFIYKLSRTLFAHAAELPAAERRLTKKLILSCRACETCRLPLTSYICPELCPKGLANGPCGCTKPDGTCELRDEECTFFRRIRIANTFHTDSSLEDVCVDSPDERP